MLLFTIDLTLLYLSLVCLTGTQLKHTVYPKKYAHGFCFAVLCCGYTLTDFPISIRLTSLALWQSNDCPSATKATLMNMDKYFMWIHYERLHNHNKAKHNKTVCIFLGIYCIHIYKNTFAMNLFRYTKLYILNRLNLNFQKLLTDNEPWIHHLWCNKQLSPFLYGVMIICHSVTERQMHNGR